MHLRCPALLLSARAHGETATIARALTEEYGVVAAYVAGGRGRRLRPVLIPGNLLDLQLSARSEAQLPFATPELLRSRGALLAEPLAAAAIGWVTALTATVLPERQPYPRLFAGLGGLLDAIGTAGAARDWLPGLLAYETLVLRELGFGGTAPVPGTLAETLAGLDRLRPLIERYLLADRRGDVMAARTRLRGLLSRME
ncbi:recombination protein O N-terminal domain-containing protein [Croceibacterium sp. TMG7-5b_MA50]|uniref:DNA repair protein RecO n=1 Tax=Croceibacterium sp. TMG7-5b_MA50 TaxID=3121290 RepID=UPI0032217983